MLIITFSPISMRASTVAELMCGRSTTLGSLSSLGLIAGSCSKTSRPAPPSSPRDQHLGHRRLVDHLAAGGVDHDGVRLQQLQPPRREQMVGRRRARAGQRDDVHVRQHLVEGVPVGRVQLRLDASGRPACGCGSGSAGRTPWRGGPAPGRCGPCRRCRALRP